MAIAADCAETQSAELIEEMQNLKEIIERGQKKSLEKDETW